MIPTPRKIDYELVPIDDFVIGQIIQIGFEKEHAFKNKFKESVQEGVFIRFKVDGLQYPKRTRWLKLVYHGKSTLLSKYLVSLVDGAFEYMNYDLERLIGMKVKMLWKNEKGTDGKTYQSIDVIRPLDGKKLPMIEGAMTPEEKAALLETVDSTDFDPAKLEAEGA